MELINLIIRAQTGDPNCACGAFSRSSLRDGVEVVQYFVKKGDVCREAVPLGSTTLNINCLHKGGSFYKKK